MTESNESGLQLLLDRQDILDCVSRCCRGIDRHDAALMASAFHPDAVINDGDFVGRAPEFVKWVNKSNARINLAHTHNITCHLAEIDGDIAHAESYQMQIGRRNDDATVVVTGGRMIDRFERRNGEWKVALRRVISDWRFQADGSVYNLPDGYVHGTWDKSDLSYQRPLQLPANLLQELEAKGKPTSD